MRKNTKMNPVNINTEEMNNPMGFNEKSEVEIYLKNIRQFEPFTRLEEISVVEEIRNGNENAFNVFVEHNLLLAYKAAKKYMHNGVPFADLIQSANEGLITAARNYIFRIGNTENGDYLRNKFSSYAIWHIRKAITEAIENEGSPVRRPHLVCNASLKIKKVIDRFENEPTIEELVKATGLTESEISAAIGTEMIYVSTDVRIDENNSDHTETLGDMLTGTMYADDELEKEDTHKKIEILMSSLNDKESLVIRMTYGIGYEYERDIKAISDELGSSPSKVKAIMNSAIIKMKKMASSIK